MQNRYRVILSSIIVALIAIGIIGFHPNSASAKQEFSDDVITEGGGYWNYNSDHVCFNYGALDKVQAKILNKAVHAGDWDGPTFDKFGAKFKKNNFSNERCKNWGSPYRYYYFMKIWKKKSPNYMYWHTHHFIGTVKRIKTSKVSSNGMAKNGTYNALEKGNKHWKVPRIDTYRIKKGKYKGKKIDIKSHLMSFKHPTVNKNGTYHICLYMIDVKDWFKHIDPSDYTAMMYIQPVTEVLHPNGRQAGGYFTSLNKWVSFMRNHGFRQTTCYRAHNHYNHKIILISEGGVEVNIQRYYFNGDKKKLTLLRPENKFKEDRDAEIQAGGALKLSKIVDWNEVKSGNENTQYYLVGYRAKCQDEKDWKQYMMFDYVKNEKWDRAGEVSQYVGEHADKTKKCKIKQDKQDSTFDAYIERVTYIENDEDETVFSEKKNKNVVRANIKIGKSKKVARPHTKKEALTVKQLAKAITGGKGIYVGKGGNMEVQLIYDKVDSGITVQYQTFSSDGKKYVRTSETHSSLMQNKTEKIIECLDPRPQKKGLTGTMYLNRFSSVFNKDNAKIFPIKQNATGKGNAYVLKDMIVQYHEKGNKKLTTRKVPLTGTEWKGEGIGEDLHNGAGSFWSGKNGEAKKIGSAAQAKLLGCKYTDVDLSKKVTITLQYFEPNIPAKQYVYEVDDKGGVTERKDLEQTPTVEKTKVGPDGMIARGLNNTKVTFNMPSVPSGYIKYGQFSYVGNGEIAGYFERTEDSVKGSTVKEVTKDLAVGTSIDASFPGVVNVVLITPQPSTKARVIVNTHYALYDANGKFLDWVFNEQYSDSGWISTIPPDPEHPSPIPIPYTIPGSISVGGEAFSFDHCKPSNSAGSHTDLFAPYSTETRTYDAYYVNQPTIPDPDPPGTSTTTTTYTWDDVGPNPGKSWDTPKDLEDGDVPDQDGMTQGHKVYRGKDNKITGTSTRGIRRASRSCG